MQTDWRWGTSCERACGYNKHNTSESVTLAFFTKYIVLERTLQRSSTTLASILHRIDQNRRSEREERLNFIRARVSNSEKISQTPARLGHVALRIAGLQTPKSPALLPLLLGVGISIQSRWPAGQNVVVTRTADRSRCHKHATHRGGVKNCQMTSDVRAQSLLDVSSDKAERSNF